MAWHIILFYCIKFCDHKLFSDRLWTQDIILCALIHQQTEHETAIVSKVKKSRTKNYEASQLWSPYCISTQSKCICIRNIYICYRYRISIQHSLNWNIKLGWRYKLALYHMDIKYQNRWNHIICMYMVIKTNIHDITYDVYAV